MTVQRKEDGVFPKTGTKVRIVKTREGSRLNVGDIVYVAGYTWESQNDALRKSKGIVVNAKPGYHGDWITAWEVIPETPLDGLDDKQKQEITDLVLKAATKHGYCGETATILGELGMPTKPSAVTKKITVEIEYTVKDGHTFVPSNLVYRDGNSDVGKPVIEIVKTTDVGIDNW